MRNRTNRTHVEDLKDLNNVPSPSDNTALLEFFTEWSGGLEWFVFVPGDEFHLIVFTPPGNRLLDLNHGSAVGASVSELLGVHIQLVWLT